MIDNPYEDDYEDDSIYDDDYWFDDTAECSACGNYYCTCCGCNCWFDDIYDDEDEGQEDE